MLQPLEAFLGCPADDFVIVNALENNPRISRRIYLPLRWIALRALLAARSPFRQRPPIGPHQRRRNINLLSIVYPFRARLRDRLTLGGFTFPRKP